MKHRARTPSRWLLAVGLAAPLFSASLSHATTCTSSYWYYPNLTTEVVPTDAVFRAFGEKDVLFTFELDGRDIPSSAAELEVDASSAGLDIELLRRDQYPIESSEFVPPTPLSPGEHEVVFRQLRYDFSANLYRDTGISDTFIVRAEEQPRATSEVAISSVTGYIGHSSLVPPEAFDGVCEGIIVNRAPDCGASGPWSDSPRPDLIESGPATRVAIPPGEDFIARVDIAASGPALGILIGSQIVPADCSAVFDFGVPSLPVEAGGTPPAVSFYARAVLPTGLGPLHNFTGDVPIVEVEDLLVPPPPLPYPESNSSLCSLGAVGARTNGSGFAALALFVSSALLRRARRAR